MSAALLPATIQTTPADPLLLAASIVVGVVGIAVLALVATATRPRRVAPAEPTMDLGDEPPAVVDLLTDDFAVTPEAVTATLLDLAARRWISIEELVDGQLRVRLRRRDGEGTLLPFEARVLQHLRTTAVDGVIPAAALTTGPEAASDAWWKGFRREVVAEARQRGLSRRRWPSFVVAVAWVTTVGAGALLALSLPDGEDETVQPSWTLAAAGALVLTALGAAGHLTSSEEERDTDAGRDRAAHWEGVRAYLEAHGRFDEASPAAVAIWDRYLAHAAALDLAPRAVRALPLGAEDDRHAWSAAGGSWRPVVVRYPRLRVGWGSHPALAVLVGIVGLALGTALAALPHEVLAGDRLAEVTDALDDLDPPVRVWVVRAMLASAALGVLVGIQSALRLVRGLLDLFTTRQVEGLVLRRRRRGGHAEIYEQQSAWTKLGRLLRAVGDQRRTGLDATGQIQRGDQPRYRWYVAVDDGTAGEIDAWRVRSSIHDACRQHQRVRVTVTPRLGYVRSIEGLADPPAIADAATAAVEAPPPPPGTPAALLLEAARAMASSHAAPATEEEP